MTALVIAAVIVFVIGLNLLAWFVFPRLSPLRRSGYRAEVHPPAGNTDHRFDPQHSWHARGGARVGRMNATFPLARIDIDPVCASIRSPWGVIAIDRTEVTCVRVIGTISSGIHFDSVDGRFDGLIFWTFNSGQVLAQFRAFGWPVPAPPSSIPGNPAPESEVTYPWLPPPPADSEPSAPPPASRPPPPATPTAAPGPAPRRGQAPHPGGGGRYDSALATGRYVGHFLSGGIVLLGITMVVASFIPSLRGHVDLSTVALATLPVIFVLFGVALFSLHATSRAYRPYRPRGPFSAAHLPESWPRRMLLFAMMIAAAVIFFTSFASTTTNPRSAGDSYTVDRNGMTVTVDESEYERVEASEQRPPLMIMLVFATFAYVTLAEVDSRHDSNEDGVADRLDE